MFSSQTAKVHAVSMITTCDYSDKDGKDKVAFVCKGSETSETTNDTAGSYLDDGGTNGNEQSRRRSESDDDFSPVPICWPCC